MDKVEDVLIDDDGVFKYILIELRDKQGFKKNIVRGFSWAEYHGNCIHWSMNYDVYCCHVSGVLNVFLFPADIMDRVAPKLDELGLTYVCIGGGRIRHDSRSKMVSVYGYSMVSAWKWEREGHLTLQYCFKGLEH